MRIIILTLVTTAISSCSNLEGTIYDRAAYDFQCPVNKLEIKQIASGKFQASGCEKVAIYECAGRIPSAEGGTVACILNKYIK